MTQELTVGLIVIVAALSAAWRWMPSGWRHRAARGVAAGTQRAGLADQARADRIAAALGKTSGCGSCDSCGACGKAGAKASQAGAAVDATVTPVSLTR